MRVTDVKPGDYVTSSKGAAPEKIDKVSGVSQTGLLDTNWSVTTISGLKLTTFQCYEFFKASQIEPAVEESTKKS